MSPEQAYAIIKKFRKDSFANTCLEYDDFYLFNMIPNKYADRDDYRPGSFHYRVDKLTGEIDMYNIFEDPVAYNSAVVHELIN